MSNKSPIWLPHLILQRNLGVKDLSKANFKAVLIEHKFGDAPTAWSAKENKPNLEHQIQSISGPNYEGAKDQLDTVEDRLKRGVHHSQTLDRGARPTHLIEENYTYDKKTGNSLIESISLRGDRVEFQLLGYNTFLFQTEYDLVKDILDKIEEITIFVTYGLSPQFRVTAVLKS